MSQNEQLSFLSDDLRMQAYRSLVQGTQHYWSKNKMQEERIRPVVKQFVDLAKQDPVFFAHLLSFIIKKSDNKDLKVIATFAGSLSDADGTPFFPGSELNKPNLRIVAQAALQELDPKLVHRVATLARMKESYMNGPQAAHMSRSLRTAIQKYLRMRELNPQAMKTSGFANTFMDLYRVSNTKPSEVAYTVLKWQQGNKTKGVIKPVKTNLLSFEGLTDLQIAEKIQKEKIPAQTALGALNKRISPVIAAAILERASGDQAVILRKLWDEQGILKNTEVKQLFESKIKTAKSLDRVERINTQVTHEIDTILKEAKAEKQKEIAGDLGSIFLHIDISGSMEHVISFAKDAASSFAECVSNPSKNFNWGLFNDRAHTLPKPTAYTKAGFHQALYGVRSFGGTDCFVLYETARKCGANFDVIFTDEQCSSSLGHRIVQANGAKPEGCVIVHFGNTGYNRVQKEYELNGIPVVVLDPNKLKESANIAETIKHALKGTNTILNEIMATPLLTLPQWWFSLSK